MKDYIVAYLYLGDSREYYICSDNAEEATAMFWANHARPNMLDYDVIAVVEV